MSSKPGAAGLGTDARFARKSARPRTIVIAHRTARYGLTPQRSAPPARAGSAASAFRQMSLPNPPRVYGMRVRGAAGLSTCPPQRAPDGLPLRPKQRDQQLRLDQSRPCPFVDGNGSVASDRPVPFKRCEMQARPGTVLSGRRLDLPAQIQLISPQTLDFFVSPDTRPFRLIILQITTFHHLRSHD